MKPINIILVDDHALFLDALQKVLSSHESFNIVSTYHHAAEALNGIKKQDVDLVISDISMPDMNGVELVKQIKKEKPATKILMVSMFPSINEIQHIDGYVLKETSYKELVHAIHTIIEGKKYFYNGYESSDKTSIEFKKSFVTNREKQIIQLIAQEFTVDQIADQLFLSRHTVETHKKNIFLKLQVNNMAGLIKKALYLGYIG